MTSNPDDGLTRRAALARFAVATGMAVSAELFGVANAAAAPAPGFNSVRRSTFVALAETYDRQPGSLVDLRGRDLAAEQSGRYNGAAEGWRTYADALLDALEAAPDGDRKFSQMTVTERRKALTEWRAARDPRDAQLGVYRSTDKDEPDDLRESIRRTTEAGNAYLATLTPEQRRVDPMTWKLGFEPPSGDPYAPPKGDPLGTVVLQRRQLRWDAYRLVAGLYRSDKTLADEVTFS